MDITSWLLQSIASNWGTVMHAPAAFIAALILGFGIGWACSSLLHREHRKVMKQRLLLYENQPRSGQAPVVAAPNSVDGFERYLLEKKRRYAAEWQPLTNEQKAALIAGWRQTLEGKELQITHNGLFDCERLATELADVLRDSGVKLIGPPYTDEEPIMPGVWICAFGGNTDEIGAQLAIAMAAVRLCQPQIVAPVGRWVRMRIGQKTKKQLPWADD
jgi:hypothetical protein